MTAPPPPTPKTAASRTTLARVAILAAILMMTLADPGRAGGTLVIVGGALEPDNRAVFEAFVGALPDEGKVVIIPAASASPASSAAGFSADLQQYGVGLARIAQFPLAVRDDETTPDADESSWRDNAWDTGLVAALGEPAGFWFTGGDQIRITEAMTRDQAEASPLLKLIRGRLAAGAVVGGTSAGAAIMGRHMIAGGDSFDALLQPVNRSYQSTDEEEGGRLLLTRGVEFLPQGVIDQHFESRARLGRLVRALGETGESFGYGIGEDTAMVVDLDSGQATVVGRRGVTLLDASNAGFDFNSDKLAQRLAIGYAPAGARFPLGQCELSGDVGSPTRGSELFDNAVESGSGMAFPHESLEDLLGPGLLDNSAASRLKRFSMRDDGSLLIYAFSETDSAIGFRTDENGSTRYSACNVRFDVLRAEWDVPSGIWVRAALDQSIPALMARADIPGLSIAVVKGGEVVWAEGYGITSTETRAPVTSETTFEAASLSKPVFALLALHAVDRGMIDLDTPIAEYFSYDRLAPDPRAARITPREVLSHQTGLPNWDREGKLDLDRDPGVRFGYSGEGYQYFQKALEAVMARPLEELAKEFAFGPFAMEDSSFLWQDEYESRLATGHDGAGTPLERNRYAEENAAYSLVTTASDYGKFLAQVMQGASLSPPLYQQMLAVQSSMQGVETRTKHPPEVWQAVHWGLGWGIQDVGDERLYFHWGDNDVYHAFAAFSLDRDIGFVYFANSQNGLRIANRIASIVVGDMITAITWLGYGSLSE